MQPTKATKAPKASKNKNKGSASTPAGLRAPPPPFQPLAPLNFDADAVSDDVKVRQETGLFRMIPVINVPLLEGQTPEEATLPEVPMVTAHRLEPKKTLKNGVKVRVLLFFLAADINPFIPAVQKQSCMIRLLIFRMNYGWSKMIKERGFF